jgi:hypothetical protein
LLCVWLLACSSYARDLIVPDHYSTIRSALAECEPGDVVVIRPGTYFEPFLGLKDGVTLRGDLEAPESIVIDGGGTTHVMRAEGITNARIEGLTITGGHANGPSSYIASGGGILVSQSQVECHRVRFVGNHADVSGGGMRILYGTVRLEECEIIGCTASKGGGAVDLSFDSHLEATDCRFEANQAGWGGAVSARTQASCRFERCDFIDNTVEPPGLGGAFFADLASHVTFVTCVLAGNEANKGGAVRLTDAVAGFSNCTLDRNVALEAGGGFFLRQSSLVIDRTIISFNDGEAVSVDRGQVWVSASDIIGNLGGDWTGAIASLLEQEDNFSADPLYCDESVHTLSAESPCAPENNPVGLIGARAVDCENVALVLRRFIAESSGGLVQLSWQVTDAAGYEFRLIGSRVADPERTWTVDHEPGDEPGEFEAVDKPGDEAFPVLYTLEARQPGGVWTLLAEKRVTDGGDVGPGLRVMRLFPNPFNPRITISLNLARSVPVRAAVYNLQGRLVRTLADEVLPAGSHDLSWDSRDDQGRQQSTGTYLLRIQGDGPAQTHKLLLIK